MRCGGSAGSAARACSPFTAPCEMPPIPPPPPQSLVKYRCCAAACTTPTTAFWMACARASPCLRPGGPRPCPRWHAWCPRRITDQVRQGRHGLGACQVQRFPPFPTQPSASPSPGPASPVAAAPPFHRPSGTLCGPQGGGGRAKAGCAPGMGPALRPMPVEIAGKTLADRFSGVNPSVAVKPSWF